MNQETIAANKELQQAIRKLKALGVELYEKGVRAVSATHYGSGDEGPHFDNGVGFEPSDPTTETYKPEQVVIDLADAIVEEMYSGYWNNEGGGGEVTLTCGKRQKDCKIVVTQYNTVEHQEYEPEATF